MDAEIAVAAQALSSAQQRKIRKPLVERKRRNRINGCLDKMKEIIINEDPRLRCRASKLEKAGILELVLEHMQKERYSSHSVASKNKSYDDGYLECLQTTFTCLNEMGMITNPRMSEMLRDKLLQHLLQKTTNNPMIPVHPGFDGHRFDPRVSGIPCVPQMPQLTCSNQVPIPDVNFIGSYDLSQEIQMRMPYVNAPGNLGISQVPSSSHAPLPVPNMNASDNSYISQLSPTVITDQMSMSYSDRQFLPVSSSISQSSSKSRFVPYKNKSRQALQNKNSCSSSSLHTLSTKTELVRNDITTWSMNDDICYSIAPFPSESSKRSDRPLSKDTYSTSHKAKKLQERTRLASMGIPRKSIVEIQRPLSTNGEMTEQQESVSSRSMADGLTFDEPTQGHLRTESSSMRSDTSTSMALPSKTSDKIKRNPSIERSFLEELNKEDVWRPF